MDDLLKRITINPKVMVGKPVIKGTRITVEHIMRELSSGITQAELLDLYPHLTAEDVRARGATGRHVAAGAPHAARAAAAIPPAIPPALARRKERRLEGR